MPQEEEQLKKPLTPVQKDQEDPGIEALSDSLQFGFTMLKGIMVFLGVAFALSGVYWVDEGEIALHLRFGELLGDKGKEVIEPGGPNFALPEPLDRILTIPTTLQEVSIDKAFWTLKEGLEGKKQKLELIESQVLEPGEDGFLVTGDKNIVHGKWAVTFHVHFDRESPAGRSAPVDFVTNVGTLERASELVQAAVEQAILHVVASTRVEEFVKANVSDERITQLAQGVLDRMHTGLQIVTLSQKENTIPIAALSEFRAVNEAESEKARKVEEAERMREEYMNQVAGTSYPMLLAALERYEAARSVDDPSAVARSEDEIMDLLLGDQVGGRVAEVISNARLYRTQTVEAIRGAASRYSQMLGQHDKNPSFYRHRQLHDVLQRIFTGDVETFYLPSHEDKTLYLELSRDPEVADKIRKESYRRQQAEIDARK